MSEAKATHTNKQTNPTHLRLSIGSCPVADTLLPDLGQAGTDLRGKLVGQRHEALRLIRGVAEHNALVASPDVLDARGVHRLRDVRGLLLDRHHHVARLVVEPLGGVVVPDVLEGVTDHLLVVHVGVGRDLPEDHDHARLGAGLARHAGALVVLEASIEHRVRDLVADLVRVTLVHRLRCEQEGAWRGRPGCLDVSHLVYVCICLSLGDEKGCWVGGGRRLVIEDVMVLVMWCAVCGGPGRVE